MISFFKKTKFYSGPLFLFSLGLSVIAIFILWLISPIVKIKIAPIVAARLGHLVAGPETFLRRRQLHGLPPRTKYIFLVGRTSNRQLLTMWKRHLPIIENWMLYGLWHRSEWLWEKTNFYHSLWHKSNEYEEFINAEPTLTFTVEEEEKGKSLLREMGINPDKDWFVCFFARDDSYLKTVYPLSDWSYHDYRNADVNTFNRAIELIVNSGGYAIRMGQHVGKPLSFHHPRLIDYALQCRSDFMDIYLSAKCTFFMGSLSGISDVAMLFDTPRLGINNAPPGNAPYSKRSLFIPKKVKNLQTGKHIPFRKLFTETKDFNNMALWSVHEFSKLGYEYEDNSEEEIFDVTKEMIDRLKGKFVQTEEDRVLQERYFQLFPTDHWSVEVKTPIGMDFIKKNQHLLI